jgi:hypothetical protein
LGFDVAEVLFVDESVALVHGLRLRDGRRIVVKEHPPTVATAFLEAVQAVQRHLVARGFPAPAPLALADGPVTAETLLVDGQTPNPGDPGVRAAMAAGLARQVELCLGLPGMNALALNPLHQDCAGDLVVGHTDWRAQNMRIADGRLTAVYDWESLDLVSEPVLAGGNAYLFTADWSSGPARFPSPDESLAFIADYERARRRPFAADEAVAARGALRRTAAYVARRLGTPEASQHAAQFEEVM